MAASFPDNLAMQQRPDDLIVGSNNKEDQTRFDPLADLVLRRWWDATTWMRSNSLQDCSVEETLYRCYRQRAGVYDPEDVALLDGIDLYIPLTDMKCMAAEAWMRDMLMSGIDMPWTLDPTPIPELPRRMQMKVLRDLKVEIVSALGDPVRAAQGFAEMDPRMAGLAFGQMISDYPGDLQAVARELKNSQQALAELEARKAASAMERLMRDQCVQMNLAKTLMDYFHDMVTYPAAILKGPILENQQEAFWDGNSRKYKIAQVLNAYRVSPFDFKPSPDSPDTQRGTYVLERFRMTRRQLAYARGLKYWIEPAVNQVIEENYKLSQQWLYENIDFNPERRDWNRGPWNDDYTITCVNHQGILSGRELRMYGFSASDRDFYEARVVVANARTLAVQVLGEPNAQLRPYHASSYEKLGEQFWNLCPTMKLRAVQRACNAAGRAQMRNMAFTSGPMVEIDYSRVQRFVSKIEDLARIEPFQARLADPDILNGGRDAYKFTNIPNVIQPLLGVLQYYFRLADDVSNIPNYAQGDPQLSGAGRTFRGFSAVFAQALKVFKMPIQNMDMDLFGPFAQMLYDHNMIYSTNDAVKGDAKIRARGAQGLVEREMAEQKSMETMQVIAQMAPAMVEAAPEDSKKVLRYVWGKALQSLGIPAESFGINPDVDAAIGADVPSSQQQPPQPDFGPQTPIPSIGKSPSPG